MKIYVSDKDIPENCAECKYYANYKCLIDNDNLKWIKQAPIEKNVNCQLKSLEQHDAEIRKPLEDEIDREIQNLEQARKEV